MRTSWNKGIHLTEEHKQHISLGNLGNKGRKGQKQSLEERKKKSVTLKGRVKTAEHIKKIADAQRGVKRPYMSLDKHPNWKGEKAIRNRRIEIREFIAGRPKPSLCEVCGGAERIVYDHNHKTGKFRGWICNACNVILGQARDNPEVLQKLISYLKKDKLSQVPLPK